MKKKNLMCNPNNKNTVTQIKFFPMLSMWKFGHTTINTEGVKLSRTKQFLVCCTFVRQSVNLY